MSPQLSQAGHGTSSVLRRMALNDAQSMATGLMLWFWCAWLALISITLLFLAPSAVLYPAVPALILGGLATLVTLRRRRRILPSDRPPASSRAPRTVRGAWTGVALVAVGCVALLVALVLTDQASSSPESVTPGVLGMFFVITLFMGTLLIPAWHIENAGRLFRARVSHDARLRQALEELARTYSDPSGRLPFGPL